MKQKGIPQGVPFYFTTDDRPKQAHLEQTVAYIVSSWAMYVPQVKTDT
jgi:hypothetical protein